MSRATSFKLFTLGRDKSGTPSTVPPASFKLLEAWEQQDIERWIKADPTIVGDDLRLIACQFAGFDKTKDRLDLLAIDRAGKLVVIELKRDVSGSGQDLQALRYAAYVAVLTAEQVIDLYRAYRAREDGVELTTAEAAAELEAFVDAGDLSSIDDDEQPRIVLVAGAFAVGVTNTVLWLSRTTTLDISCVKITPYEVGGEILLGSNVLIPLPEAEEFEVRLRDKRARARRTSVSLDLDAARAFIASIPEGRWTSYGDVAAAAGNSRAGQPIGTWLSNKGDDIPLVYRILNRRGEVSDGWRTVNPELPPTQEAVRQRLKAEGVRFRDQRADQEQRWTVEDMHASFEGLDL